MCKGLTGYRYLPTEIKPGEHLFSTLNSIIREDSTVQGMSCLERLIITHPDIDHIQGIDLLLVIIFCSSNDAGC